MGELSLSVRQPTDVRERDRAILRRMSQPGKAGAAAMAELYDAYGRLVFSLVVKMVGDLALAEDLVQEVFVRVWRAAPTYQPELGTVRAWLLAITHHRVVDELRRGRHERDWISLEATDLERLGAAVDESDADPLVRQALATLPPEQLQVIQLAYFHGLTGVEIATRLNLPLGTVKSRLRLGPEKLRTALGMDRDGPP